MMKPLSKVIRFRKHKTKQVYQMKKGGTHGAAALQSDSHYGY
jgi:hypothetical protein